MLKKLSLATSSLLLAAVASTSHALDLPNLDVQNESRWFLDVGLNFGAEDQTITYTSTSGYRGSLTAEGTLVYNVRAGKTNLTGPIGGYAEFAFSGQGVTGYYADYSLYGGGATYDLNNKLTLSAGLGVYTIGAGQSGTNIKYIVDEKSGSYVAFGAAYELTTYTVTAQFNTITGMGIGFGRKF